MSSSDSQQRHFSFRIERGQTRFPERPIDEERFLIGAGSNCHLQLSGGMPILHSVVIASPEGLWIDSVVKTPQLLVNRQAVRESKLLSGDILEIGDFIFVVEERSVVTDPTIVDGIENEQVDLRELSAEDLVDLLNEEMTTIEEYETAQAAGVVALRDAAADLQRKDQSQDDLHSFVAQLAKRAIELDEREALLAKKADHLQKSQERLDKQVEQLNARLNETQDDGNESFRKTA